jgi:hypothetical protein
LSNNELERWVDELKRGNAQINFGIAAKINKAPPSLDVDKRDNDINNRYNHFELPERSFDANESSDWSTLHPPLKKAACNLVAWDEHANDFFL